MSRWGSWWQHGSWTSTPWSDSSDSAWWDNGWSGSGWQQWSSHDPQGQWDSQWERDWNNSTPRAYRGGGTPGRSSRHGSEAANSTFRPMPGSKGKSRGGTRDDGGKASGGNPDDEDKDQDPADTRYVYAMIPFSMKADLPPGENYREIRQELEDMGCKITLKSASGKGKESWRKQDHY